jgi:hypothetical protein
VSKKEKEARDMLLKEYAKLIAEAAELRSTYGDEALNRALAQAQETPEMQLLQGIPEGRITGKEAKERLELADRSLLTAAQRLAGPKTDA